MYLLPAGAARSNRKASAVSLRPMARRTRGLGQDETTFTTSGSSAMSIPSSIDIPGVSIPTVTPLLLIGGAVLLGIYLLGATRGKRVARRRARYSRMPEYLAQVGI